MLIGSKLIKNSDLGIGGLLYGGRLLEFVAEQAAIYARKCTGAPHLLGYRFAEIVISHPVREGEILDFYGESPTVRTSSITFDLFARSGTTEIVRARCTFVAVDDQGQKYPIALLQRLEE